MNKALEKEVVQALAPTGRLRAVINVGNPILAKRVPGSTAEVEGVSVDLAKGLAASIGCELELTVVESAGRSVECLGDEQVDVGFVALDPLRAETLAFTPPYVLIEGAYLVHDNSPVTRMDMVDQPGHRVVVGKGSAYDLHLTRTLKNASIVRAATSPTVVDHFLAEGCDVSAGVRQQLESDVARHAGLRLLPGNFMVIAQAMAVPRSRGDQVRDVVAAYVQSQKSQGVIALALERHGIDGARVAPS